ncbi:hypothetical protein NM688_g4277 [Phlebia brevispora]|uniref:Uncharacterized protein n=1 Tax=Phlebia brevispora TaxID=194682 RepID=A0ACC1T3D6_9APHY|nr:hypothetical protein NM688_g4277 [Phlebia brevispora]
MQRQSLRQRGNARSPPVPLFDEQTVETENEEPDGGMLAFSQMLQSIGGGYTMGGLDDDDEIDSGVFLGDADEAKGM